MILAFVILALVLLRSMVWLGLGGDGLSGVLRFASWFFLGLVLVAWLILALISLQQKCVGLVGLLVVVGVLPIYLLVYMVFRLLWLVLVVTLHVWLGLGSWFFLVWLVWSSTDCW